MYRFDSKNDKKNQILGSAFVNLTALFCAYFYDSYRLMCALILLLKI